MRALPERRIPFIPSPPSLFRLSRACLVLWPKGHVLLGIFLPKISKERQRTTIRSRLLLLSSYLPSVYCCCCCDYKGSWLQKHKPEVYCTIKSGQSIVYVCVDRWNASLSPRSRDLYLVSHLYYLQLKNGFNASFINK